MYFLCTATVSDRSNHDMTHLSDLAKRCLPKHDVISGGGGLNSRLINTHKLCSVTHGSK